MDAMIDQSQPDIEYVCDISITEIKTFYNQYIDDMSFVITDNTIQCPSIDSQFKQIIPGFSRLESIYIDTDFDVHFIMVFSTESDAVAWKLAWLE